MSAAGGELPLVLLPGLAGHRAEFEGVARSWTHGPTLCLEPFVAGDLSVAGQADQTHAAARAAGFDSYLVAGHSQGGLVALELSVRQPRAVVGVAILDSPVVLPRALRAALRSFAALLGTWMGPTLLRTFFRATFVEADGPAFRDEVMARLADVPRGAAHQIVGAAFGYDASPALISATVPVAYVRANIPTPLDQLPATVRGVDVPGAGHWVHVHRSMDVIAVLNDLVAAADTTTSHIG
jgi:pimeloyl-ACP methyl ester carboxylesterase